MDTRSDSDENFQVVGESGLFTPADIAYVQEAGVKAVSSKNLAQIMCFCAIFMIYYS